ncbi:MAG: hypothetical protein AAF703_08415 [Cyanobacteria bacterium P01_D01_bin.105]
MPDNQDGENPKLPAALFGALLQTGAGMALLGSAALGSVAIASPSQRNLAASDVTSSATAATGNNLQAPRLVLQPDGTVSPQVTADISTQFAKQPFKAPAEQVQADAKGVCFTVDEDGAISLQEIEEPAEDLAAEGESNAPGSIDSISLCPPVEDAEEDPLPYES